MLLPLGFSRLQELITSTVRIQPSHVVLEVRCQCYCEVTRALRWRCLVGIGVPKSNIKYLCSFARANSKSHLQTVMPDPWPKKLGNMYQVLFKFLLVICLKQCTFLSQQAASYCGNQKVSLRSRLQMCLSLYRILSYPHLDLSISTFMNFYEHLKISY